MSLVSPAAHTFSVQILRNDTFWSYHTWVSFQNALLLGVFGKIQASLLFCFYGFCMYIPLLHLLVMLLFKFASQLPFLYVFCNISDSCIILNHLNEIHGVWIKMRCMYANMTLHYFIKCRITIESTCIEKLS